VSTASWTINGAFERAWGSLSERAFGSENTQASEAEPLRPSILPKNYLVEFIAGTFGPASSGKGLTTHLETEENLRRVVTRTNLGVMTAQDLEATSQRKLEEVNATRAVKFKHVIEFVSDHLQRSARRTQDRPHVIREIFYLDDSPLAQHIARRMADTRFLERLASKSAAIPDCRFADLKRASTARRFATLEGRFRTELASFVPPFEVDHEGVRQPIADDKVLKIVNRIFDVFAPRMILIGHSQGGLVALRTMQLGMRRVRVDDSRRYLYSPRSGREHRYSPVALAIGLASPFDGLDKIPPEFNFEEMKDLDAESLPDYVKRFMPGVGQMLHGSAFLKTMREAFIPFDTSAISIGNPKDGFVSLEGTRLPVGDFVNMHNLKVGSTGRFDVADMAPEILRPVFGYWPTRRLREVLNDDPGYEGLRQHCSLLFDLDANWDVDKGEIMRQIFASENGQGIFDEMMLEVNFDGVREQLIANLLYKLRGLDSDDRSQLAWLVPRLQAMIQEEELPFLNSLDKRAGLALNYIEPQ
jgi:hypothetical protein